MKKTLYIQIAGSLTLIFAILFSSCTKMNEYEKYLEGTSAYTQKIDSVKVYSGRNRVMITGLFTSDPKITETRVFWNNGKDSVSIPVVRTNAVDTFKTIINNLEEQVHNFTIITYNKSGVKSVPVRVIGEAFGSRYQASLANRPITQSLIDASNSITTKWGKMDLLSGAFAIQTIFSNNLDLENKKEYSVKADTSIFKNVKAGTGFKYRTLFLPNSTSIDTFYTDFQQVRAYRDVTSLYLSNTGPFTKATLSGRWGTLAAPWVTNAAAKNKGGLNGGYTSDDGGAINWETYGNDPVINGILYQATSIPLPAGNYTVSFDEYSEIQTNSSVYCVAAAGGDGIPVLANLSTALAYRALYNGAVTGTAAPSVTDTRSFNFTLTTSQVVSIGFLGNVAAAPRGNYFRVKNIKLFSNN